MDTFLPKYVHLFSRLRTDKTGGWTQSTNFQAPHKPFLLLAVLDLFAGGRLASNLIEITPELGELFAGYWSKVMPPERRGNLALPFFHLRSSRFWHLVPRPGQESALDAVRQVDSLSRLNKLILGACLDEDLYRLLQVEGARSALRVVLLQTYFAPEIQPLLSSQSDLNLQSSLYSRALIERARRQLKESPPGEDYQAAVRDQGFRRAVTRLYDHRCAICGLRVLTSEGRTVVDAAHIIPWRVSQDDDPHNGMALCRLCHWTYDQGLLAVSAKYLVLLSSELRLTPNVPGHLLTLEKRPILGPAEQELWPWTESLDWHRRNVFRKR